jgi:N-formylglutamate deformylase
MIRIDGPAQAAFPLVLDSPHSGTEFPGDFGAAVSEFELREGEDCFVDELWRPATALGVPLLSALFPRTYLDPNRHHGDIDLDLIEGGLWPHEFQPSGKAKLGQALVWRTLGDGRPIYARKLSVAEVQGRIERCHAPYHAALRRLLDEGHARHGRVLHLNCHSMASVANVQSDDGAGTARADFVLGDRDGTTCAPQLTQRVRETLESFGYSVAVNWPYKGVELVRAYAAPAQGRHSLQVEINKKLYMDEPSRCKHAGFSALQADLLRLIQIIRAELLR